ncbi:hypothetical protein [Cohnella sp. 56]|uniref:hypothetical protein n=1 Tax=Cohnella sp. 56 TaxID=3113722 RepID=UPI0030E7B57B
MRELIRNRSFVRLFLATITSQFGSVGLLEATDVWVYLAFVFLVGFAMAPVNIALGGWLPSLIESRQLGRVSALYDPLLMAGQAAALAWWLGCIPVRAACARSMARCSLFYCSPSYSTG